MRSDTRTLLRVGAFMLVGAIISAIEVVMTGGMGPHGAKTDAGWLGIIFGCGLAPMALFTLLLGFWKWRGDSKR